MSTNKKIFIPILLLVNILTIYAISISKVDDVVVAVNGDEWLCDRIYCPLNAMKCVVIKRNAPQKANTLLRTNTCYSTTGEVISQSNFYEPIGNNISVNVNVVAYRNGAITSSNAVVYSGDWEGYANIPEQFQMPIIEIPKIKIPKIEIPKIEFPKIAFPKIQMPQINWWPWH